MCIGACGGSIIFIISLVDCFIYYCLHIHNTLYTQQQIVLLQQILTSKLHPEKQKSNVSNLLTILKVSKLNNNINLRYTKIQ